MLDGVMIHQKDLLWLLPENSLQKASPSLRIYLQLDEKTIASTESRTPLTDILSKHYITEISVLDLWLCVVVYELTYDLFSTHIPEIVKICCDLCDPTQCFDSWAITHFKVNLSQIWTITTEYMLKMHKQRLAAVKTMSKLLVWKHLQYLQVLKSVSMPSKGFEGGGSATPETILQVYHIVQVPHKSQPQGHVKESYIYTFMRHGNPGYQVCALSRTFLPLPNKRSLLHLTTTHFQPQPVAMLTFPKY